MLTTTHRLDRPARFRTDSEKLAEPTTIAPFETELNWMAIAWREDTLVANVFGYPSRRLAEFALARIPGMPQTFCRVSVEGQVDDVPQWVGNLIAKLKLYAAGEKVDFADTPLSLDHLTTFGARVIAVSRSEARRDSHESVRPLHRRESPEVRHDVARVAQAAAS